MFEEGGYSIMKAYGNSKLSNLLFTYELQRKFEKFNLDCISVAAHPGIANSNLAKHVTKRLLYKIGMGVSSIISQTSLMGVLPEIRASVDPHVKGGEYFGPDGFKEWKGHPVKVKSNEGITQYRRCCKFMETLRKTDKGQLCFLAWNVIKQKQNHEN